MPDIALLDPGNFFVEQQRQYPLVRDEVEAIDIYDLPDVDLSRFLGLFVPGLADQEFLLWERERIRAFLDDGKVLVFSGHLFRPWLPGGSAFVPKAIRSVRDYTVQVARPHPIFEGVEPQDLTFRKGVAGFFARGHHPPPDGVEVLLTLAGGEPIVYLDRRSTRGTILAHAGNDLLGYAGSETTAGRIVPQLLRWMRQEFEALQEGRSRA